MFLALSGVGVEGNGSVYEGIFMLWGGVGLGVLGRARAGARGGIVQHVANQSINLHHSTHVHTRTHTYTHTHTHTHTHTQHTRTLTHTHTHTHTYIYIYIHIHTHHIHTNTHTHTHTHTNQSINQFTNQLINQ